MMRHRAAWVAGAGLAAGLAALAATAGATGAGPKTLRAPHTELLEPIHDESYPLPRNMTPEERAYVEKHGHLTPRAITPPPTGPVRTVAEYEGMEGILLVWSDDPPTDSISSGWKAIVEQMAASVTTTGDAKAFVVTATASQANVARAGIVARGGDTTKIVSYVREQNTIWMRDYGPRYIYQGDVRAIVDHVYNRPRPKDDAFPAAWAASFGIPYYEHGLVHGGGNFHLDAAGLAWSTELIADENPLLTESEIVQIWQEYQDLDTTITDALPATVDSTQHIDMWMIRTDDDTVIINDYPLAPGSAHDVVCDTWAATLAGQGYNVFRINAKGNPGATHYTYTNAVICNDLVLVPFYNGANAPPASYNTDAVAIWQSACPDKTVVQVDCDLLVTFAGVMHCIVMHVPANKNGANPGAYLVNLNGGETLEPDDVVDIEWLSDDDVAVSNVDILLSLDGGATFPTVLASATADDGSYSWTVPDVYSTEARVRVVARDAQGNTGADDSDADFTINGAPACVGDLNGDGDVNTADLGLLMAAFGPSGGPEDLNGDLMVDTADLGLLLGLFGACP